MTSVTVKISFAQVNEKMQHIIEIHTAPYILLLAGLHIV